MPKITCPTDSELDTKRAIEATRNPNVLIEIISHDKTKEELVELQPAFTEIREILAKSDSIIAGFLPLEPCEGNCEACMIHAKNIERRSVLEIMLMAMRSH